MLQGDEIAKQVDYFHTSGPYQNEQIPQGGTFHKQQDSSDSTQQLYEI